MPTAPDRPNGLAHLTETAAATERYLEALTSLSESDVRAASLLPDWSRGHVITHVARNADGLSNLLVSARTRVETPQYSSWAQRNLDIDSGSGRGAEELLADSRTSAERFFEEVSRLKGEHWDVPVRTLSSKSFFPARDVLSSRRTEVEVHHADLDLAYAATDWPGDFTEMLIGRAQNDQADGPSMVLSSTDTSGSWKFGRGQGPVVSGTKADLAW